MLDDISRLADSSHSFVTFMSTCWKFGYSLLYIFHETAISSPYWKDISQTPVFCAFPSAMDLVLNHLVKFVTSNGDKGCVNRQQLWLTNLVRSITIKPGYSSFCLDKRPHVFGAACYRSQVENSHNQFFYLNSSTSDKLFYTFASRRADNKDQIKFIIEKQVGEIGSD